MKKILLAFDGSGENPDLNLLYSNVLKLHLLAGGSIDQGKTKERVKNQISLYINGVGSFSDNATVRAVKNQLGFLSQQTRPMMRRLQEIYEPGDKLYFVGFSRGASSARNFAVNLHKNGLRTASGKKVEKVPIEFLACFDTVSWQTFRGLINPLKRLNFYKRMFTKDIISSSVLGEKDGQLPPNVKKAVHLVSMGDRRSRVFTPVHMDSKDDRVHEIWFTGAHSDVGGSYAHQEMSNIAGRFMKKFLEDAGLKFLELEEVDLESLKNPDNPELNAERKHVSLEPNNPKGLSHTASMPPVDDSPRKMRSVSKNEVIENGTIRIHESFLERISGDDWPDMISGDDISTKESYKINPYVLEAKFVVVGDLDKELPGKTKQLEKTLKNIGDSKVDAK